jgi:3-oxoacyl-[acyl-carrier protein] reductase
MKDRSRPVAVVTGAGRSLGRAIAELLHGEGYVVAVTDIDLAAAEAVTTAQDPATSSTARPYRLDVRSSQEVGAVFDAVAVDLGPPNALVNNAGIYPDHAILDMPEDAWDAVLDTNLKGTFLCSQAFARLRVAAAGGGAIVNLASTAGFSARVGAAHYSASKAGVVMLTKSLAQELGPHGIRVNAVAPGLIEVREDQVSAAYKERFLTMIPRGRTGRAPDVAQVVRFLLSDAADYVTGECILVDGGFLAGRSLLRSSSS